MLQLNAAQYDALKGLVEGNGKPVNKNTLKALRTRELVNSWGHPTTTGWHVVGQFRYVPRKKTMTQIEIDSWKDCVLRVEEKPDYYFNDDGEQEWHRADFQVYYFDFHKIAQWYAKIVQAEADYIESEWSKDADFEVASWGYDQSYVLHLETKAKNAALSKDDDRYYTNSIFYSIASAFTGYQKAIYRDSDTSFKYSLQDNEDEFEQWRLPDLPPGACRLHWTVTVD